MLRRINSVHFIKLTMKTFKFQNFKFSLGLMLVTAMAIMSCAPETPESASFGDSALEPAIASKTLTISEQTSETAMVTFEKATKEGADDATISYQVYYSTEANIYDLDSATTNGTAFDSPIEDISQKMVTGLTVNTSYYFNVVARNTAGNGAAYSMTVSSTTDGGSEIPTFTANALTFTDSDLNSGEIEGTLTIGMANDETDITHYAVYWGVGDDTLLEGSTVITEIQKTGADLTYDFAANTAVPDTANYFVVRTKNAKGEMTTGSSLALNDVTTPGIASSIAFTDSDTDSGQIAGTIYIGKATNEGDITHYVLYWGSSADAKQSQTPLATIAKTGADLGFSVPADTGIPPGATHLLVFTKNNATELTTPVAVALVDIAIPTSAAAAITFTDTDKHGSEIGGTITITKATVETSITHYLVYWGTNATTKLGGVTAMATIAKTGMDLSVAVPTNTAIPALVTHLLVFTKNDYGEMATGVNVAITDAAIPVNKAQMICFNDEKDTRTGEIRGDVIFQAALSESDITTYTLYWSNDGITQAAGIAAIGTVPSGGSTLIYNGGTTGTRIKPLQASHFVLFTSNADGEMDTGIGIGPVDDLTTNPADGAGNSVTSCP